MTTRFRDRTIEASWPLTAHLIDVSSGNTVQNVSSTNTFNLYESMTDEVSPGYFSKSKRGQFLPVNPMTQTKRSEFHTFGSLTVDSDYNGSPTYRQEFSGAIAASAWFWHYGSQYNPPYSGSYPSWPDSSTVQTEALANARSRGFDMLTFLAEFRKTMDLIKGFRTRTLKRAEKVADSIGKTSDPASAFAETWLEARYGWRILAYDIAGINESIEKLNSMHSPLIRGYAEESASSSVTVQTYSPSNIYLRRYSPYSNASFGGGATFVVTQEATRQIRSGAILEAVLDDIIEIDPLVTGWEVIPFSFILDWFINIGDVITAYSPFASENLLGAWVKETEEVTTLVTMIPATHGTSGSGWYRVPNSTEPQIASITNTTVSRSAVSPSASLSFRLNIDDLKIIDLASIFLGQYTRVLGGILKSNRV